MAKKTTTKSITRYVAPPAGRPQSIVVNVPRQTAMAAPKSKGGKKGHHRRHGGGESIVMFMGAGAALGYLDSQGTSIPTLPILGRAGTLAAVSYFLRAKSKWFDAASKAFSAIAAYEIISKGSISGDVVPQVSGYDEMGNPIIAPQA